MTRFSLVPAQLGFLLQYSPYAEAVYGATTIRRTPPRQLFRGTEAVRGAFTRIRQYAHGRGLPRPYVAPQCGRNAEKHSGNCERLCCGGGRAGKILSFQSTPRFLRET